MNIVGSRRSIGRVHNVQFSPKFSQKKTSYLSHVPKIQNFVVSESPIICKVDENQGWELDLWFFVRIARFLESERAIRCFHFFCKEWQEQIALATLFKWATGASHSHRSFYVRATGVKVIFYKEREERWRAIHSFDLGLKRRKVLWKERIWSESILKRVNQS